MNEPCCALHRDVACCDPEDCGPCCEKCPTCPSLQRVATFVVYGIPEKQGSVRAYAGKDGVARVRQGGSATRQAKLEDWRHAVASEARLWMGSQPHGLLDEPVVVEVWFHLPRPKSAPRSRVYPDRLPDVDKLGRAVGDALTGVVLADDARIVDLLLHKRYATDERPRAEITVRTMRSVANRLLASVAKHPAGAVS